MSGCCALSDRAIACVLRHAVALATREVEREREAAWLEGTRNGFRAALDAPSRAVAAGRCLHLRLLGRQWAALLVRDHAVSRERAFTAFPALVTALSALEGAGAAFVGALAVQVKVRHCGRNLQVERWRNGSAAADAESDVCGSAAALARLGALTVCLYAHRDTPAQNYGAAVVRALATHVAPHLGTCELMLPARVHGNIIFDTAPLPYHAFTCVKLYTMENGFSGVSESDVLYDGTRDDGRLRRLCVWGAWCDSPYTDNDALTANITAGHMSFSLPVLSNDVWLARHYPHVRVEHIDGGDWRVEHIDGCELGVDCEAQRATVLAAHIMYSDDDAAAAAAATAELFARAPHVRLGMVAALALLRIRWVREGLTSAQDVFMRLCAHGLDVLAPLPGRRADEVAALPLFVAARGPGGSAAVAPLLAYVAPGRLAGAAADGKSWLWHAASRNMLRLARACVADGARATADELVRAAETGIGALLFELAEATSDIMVVEHARVRAAWLEHRHRYEDTPQGETIAAFFEA